MSTLKLAIEGMSCGHCLNAVNKSLTALRGVKINSVGIGRADLEFDPEAVSAADIVAAIGDAGYRATEVRG